MANKYATKSKSSIHSNKNLNSKFSPCQNKQSTFPCNICNKNISSNLFEFHKEQHPSKIYEWLYIGSFSNAMNLTVSNIELNLLKKGIK